MLRPPPFTPDGKGVRYDGQGLPPEDINNLLKKMTKYFFYFIFFPFLGQVQLFIWFIVEFTFIFFIFFTAVGSSNMYDYITLQLLLIVDAIAMLFEMIFRFVVGRKSAYFLLEHIPPISSSFYNMFREAKDKDSKISTKASFFVTFSVEIVYRVYCIVIGSLILRQMDGVIEIV